MAYMYVVRICDSGGVWLKRKKITIRWFRKWTSW